MHPLPRVLGDDDVLAVGDEGIGGPVTHIGFLREAGLLALRGGHGTNVLPVIEPRGVERGWNDRYEDFDRFQLNRSPVAVYSANGLPETSSISMSFSEPCKMP